MDFSSAEFRKALGLFPTGVAVVTARAESGRLIGITVNSFTSVSLDPPLVSVNLAKSLQSIEELSAIKSFAINFLTEEQSELSTSFARAATDKWSAVNARFGRNECPILDPHLAAFECERYAVHEAGDHLILLGRVRHFEINEAGEPLVFFRGRYRTVGGPVEQPARN